MQSPYSRTSACLKGCSVYQNNFFENIDLRSAENILNENILGNILDLKHIKLKTYWTQNILAPKHIGPKTY